MISRALRTLPLGILSVLVLPSTGFAAAPGGSLEDAEVNYQAPKTERRGGFAAGVTTYLSMVNVTGYPNEAEALGDPSRETSTGTQAGLGQVLWFGGSIRDFVSAGVGLVTVSPFSPDYRASNVGFVLHLEAFPLYGLGHGFQDFGVAFDGGPGSGAIYAEADKDLENPLAMGGAMSFLGLSAFWEPVRFWHFSLGPSMTLTHSFSQSMNSTQLGAGLRLTFYGDQPSPEATQTAATSSPGAF